MQVPERSGWLNLVFRVRGSELPRTRWRIVAVVLVACAVTFLEEQHDWHPNLTPLPFSLIGVALGIFLGFRNNASYDRWWEGRKIWGALVNESRSFARRALTANFQGHGARAPVIFSGSWGHPIFRTMGPPVRGS